MDLKFVKESPIKISPGDNGALRILVFHLPARWVLIAPLDGNDGAPKKGRPNLYSFRHYDRPRRSS